MPPLKFCANISWLFTELPDFPQRMYAAAAAGFQAVEAGWLYDTDLHELLKAKHATGVDVVLINTPPGNVKVGDLGLGAVRGRETEFKQGLDLALQYAKALDCKRIHLMAGRIPEGSQRASVATEMEEIFVRNLKYAADVLSEVADGLPPIIETSHSAFHFNKVAIFKLHEAPQRAKDGLTGLIEPINTRITDPRYFLDCPHHAAAILEKVGKPNIKLQLDMFHWQIMDGNLTQNLQKYVPLIGHVQVAQVPGRNEPDSPGELDYNYLLTLLQQLGYQGHVGCEYKPLGATAEGLGWVRRWMQME